MLTKWREDGIKTGEAREARSEQGRTKRIPPVSFSVKTVGGGCMISFEANTLTSPGATKVLRKPIGLQLAASRHPHAKRGIAVPSSNPLPALESMWEEEKTEGVGSQVLLLRWEN